MAPMKYLLKYLPHIAGILLGALFLMASGMFFLGMGPKELPPEGTPVRHFMDATGPTHFMTFVKVFELVGGILVMIPRLRNFGLLLLVPIIVNIVAFHIFVVGNPKTLLVDPMHVAVWVLPLYLLWVSRRSLAGLVNKP